jgi:polysaccharide pyruvyl transferase WcaK-like protein
MLRSCVETPLQVLHLANHSSTNIGNGALISGVESTLREDFTTPLSFLHEPWDDYTIPDAPKHFGQQFVELCRNKDFLIVGAAVTMVGSPQHSQAGMRFDLPLELWDRIECPLIFYGLSYRTWATQTYHHKEKLRAAIHYALENERCLFSVRNDGTRAWLSQLLGMDYGGIHEVPDPALFVETDARAAPWHLEQGRINIAVSLNDEDRKHRFMAKPSTLGHRVAASLHPSRGVRRRMRLAGDKRHIFVQRMADVLDRLAQSHPVQIILCPHHHEDFRMIADFFERCSSRLKHQIAIVNGLPKATYARQFYNFYRNVDLTLAMRVHSMTPSIGLQTPTLALCSQPRMFDFMKDAGLDAYALDIFAEDFAERLWAACEGVIADPDHAREDMRRATTAMRRRTREFNLLVQRLVCGKVRRA